MKPELPRSESPEPTDQATPLRGDSPPCQAQVEDQTEGTDVVRVRRTDSGSRHLIERHDRALMVQLRTLPGHGQPAAVRAFPRDEKNP